MEASCCCYYDGPMPELFSQGWRVARKVHRCCECFEEIKPGTRYQYTVGKWDGDFMDFKTCPPCAAIRDEICGNYGDLNDCVMDCWGVGLTYTPGEE